MGRERRRHPRVVAATLSTFSDRRKDGLYHTLGAGTVVDISETGMRVRTNEALSMSQRLSFVVVLDGRDHAVPGRVIWGEELEEGASYDYGVSFAELPDETLAALRGYVADRLEREAASARDAQSTEDTAIVRRHAEDGGLVTQA